MTTDFVGAIIETMDRTQVSHQFLHSFCINPDVRFGTQTADESVILVLRAHPITQVGWILNSIFLLLLLFIGNLFLSGILTVQQMLFTTIFGLVLITSYVFFNFITWYFNVGIVTNKRLIDIDYQMVIYREVTEARLVNIEDITSKSGGFIESFFDFGDVFVQTAGTDRNIEFDNIPEPSDAVRIIDDLTGK